MFERKVVGMGSGARLGAVRILVVLAAVSVVLSENITAFADLPYSWYHSHGLLKVIPALWIQPLVESPLYLLILKAALLVFLTAALIGAAVRFSLAGASVLFFVYLGILNGFADLPDMHLVTLYLLFFLTWLPCGDALSVDAALRKKDSFRVEQRFSPETGWAVFFLRMILAVSFFQTGFAKLHNSGWAWTEAWNLKRLILENRFAHLDFNSAWLDYFLSWPDEVWRLLASVMLLMELFFPAVLFSWRLRRVYPFVYLVIYLLSAFLSGRIMIHAVLLLLIFLDFDRMLQLTPTLPQDRRQGMISLWPRRS